MNGNSIINRCTSCITRGTPFKIRVSKKSYVRKNMIDFIEVTDDIELPF
ncbi:hypothetical protein HMPREF3195_00170 [Peptostreptococcus anaerobius]|uniref:Uncharacterized protein n=1 Tax=Peptostreptococcus anaerobius TaxID=1261 RepID=A0A135YYV3_9FIRM|nr:hypothetical protein HMPREF3195_00170 [Peptostreptococcus anaerobius]